MNQKRILLFLTLVASVCFWNCEAPSPKIISGREWNAGQQTVADTASAFLPSDPFYVQLDYGKGFDFDSLTCEIYDGQGKKRYARTTGVSPRVKTYTLQGKKKGKIMTYGDFFRSQKPQTGVVKFLSNGKLVAEKQIQVLEKHQ